MLTLPRQDPHQESRSDVGQIYLGGQDVQLIVLQH